MSTAPQIHYSPLPSHLTKNTNGKNHSLLNTFLALGATFTVLVLILLISVLVQKRSVKTDSEAAFKPSIAPTVSVPTVTIRISPMSVPLGSDEAELEAIDIGTIEADLKDIQKDFQGL